MAGLPFQYICIVLECTKDYCLGLQRLDEHKKKNVRPDENVSSAVQTWLCRLTGVFICANNCTDKTTVHLCSQVSVSDIQLNVDAFDVALNA